MLNNANIICAISTPTGSGAISIIRVTGNNCLKVVNKMLHAKVSDKKQNIIHKNKILYNNKIIDEIMISFFKNPKSLTKRIYKGHVDLFSHRSIFVPGSGASP